MSFLKITQIRLHSGPATSAVVDYLRSNELDIHIYSCIEDPSLLYVFSDRESSTVPDRFPSEDISNENRPFDVVFKLYIPGSISQFPLNAPVLAIARLFIIDSGSHIHDFADTVNKYEHVIASSTYSDDQRVLSAWEITKAGEGSRTFDGVGTVGWEGGNKDGGADDSSEGKKDTARTYVMVSGWESKEHHAVFTKGTRAKYPEYGKIREHYAGMEVLHVRKVEG